MNHFLANFRRIILLLGDILLMFGALWLALFIRHGANYSLEIWQSHWQIFGVLYLIWLPIYYAFNLYDFSANLYVVSLITNLLKATIVNTIIAIFYFYLISPDVAITPKTILAINIVLLTVVIFIWRRLFTSLIKTQALENNIIFIGWDSLIKEIIENGPALGYNPKAVFTDLVDSQKVSGLSIYSDLSKLPEIIKQEKIHLAVLAGLVSEKTTNQLFQTLKLRINFISLTHFYEQIFQKIPLSIINQGWFLENLSEGNKAPFEILKRTFDLVFAIILGFISLPFIPLISFLVALDSKGPIFFSQIRTGKDGKKFKAIKFRTMYQNSEVKGPQWAKENDPRVTKIGRLLRNTRIDEIPQLWNIFIGQMSFVGPRPERPEFVEDLAKSIPFYQERLLIKPGLTGWAQINFPYASSFEDSLKKLQYDLYYIKNRNFFLDLGIILKTLNIILKGGGR